MLFSISYLTSTMTLPANVRTRALRCRPKSTEWKLLGAPRDCAEKPPPVLQFKYLRGGSCDTEKKPSWEYVKL